LPADFDETLAGVITEFTTATQTKATGLAGQVQGTAGIRAATLNGVSIVRELGAIFKVRYENNPGLMAAWKSASHVDRPLPKPKAPATPATLAIVKAAGSPVAPAEQSAVDTAPNTGSSVLAVA